jgi:hypothetical protein
MRSIRTALLLLVVAACGGETSLRREEQVDFMETAPATDRNEVAQSASGGVVPRAPAPRQASQPVPVQTPAVPAMIIRTGNATVEVDSLERAVARVRRMAQELGGYVGNTSQTGGEREARTATLELKIPAPRFDQALGGLRPLGEVQSVNVQAQDVGEEFVDVSARQANARRLEERLVSLLATRTGKLEDVLAVERELARVRGEIESAEGRLRYLRTRVAVSTLTVTLREPAPVIGDYPGSNPVLDAFGDAWRNFVGFLAFFIASLGVLIPLGLILAVLWWAIRRLRARRTPPPAAP